MKIDKDTIYFDHEDCQSIEAMVEEMRGSAIEEDADLFNPNEVPLLSIVKAHIISKGYCISMLKRKQIIGDNRDQRMIDAISTHCYGLMLWEYRIA